LQLRGASTHAENEIDIDIDIDIDARSVVDFWQAFGTGRTAAR
jgi:hypothetical protein